MEKRVEELWLRYLEGDLDLERASILLAALNASPALLDECLTDLEMDHWAQEKGIAEESFIRSMRERLRAEEIREESETMVASVRKKIVQGGPGAFSVQNPSPVCACLEPSQPVRATTRRGSFFWARWAAAVLFVVVAGILWHFSADGPDSRLTATLPSIKPSPPEAMKFKPNLELVTRHFGTSHADPNWDPKADLNGDGRVSMEDLALLSRSGI